MDNATRSLLVRIAQDSQFRTDKTIDLKLFEPSIGIKRFAGGTRFVDKEDPKFDGGSELSYRFNVLLEYEFIKSRHLGEETEERILKGGTINIKHKVGDGLRITHDGIRQVRDWDKSWLSRAIDKQPMTFIQVLFSVANLIFFLVNVYLAWRIEK